MVPASSQLGSARQLGVDNWNLHGAVRECHLFVSRLGMLLADTAFPVDVGYCVGVCVPNVFQYHNAQLDYSKVLFKYIHPDVPRRTAHVGSRESH